jgi:predicted nucleic acid-binding Zn ribbon protein
MTWTKAMDKRVRKTVFIMFGIAILLYLGFILMAMTGNLQPPVRG